MMNPVDLRLIFLMFIDIDIVGFTPMIKTSSAMLSCTYILRQNTFFFSEWQPPSLSPYLSLIHISSQNSADEGAEAERSRREEKQG